MTLSPLSHLIGARAVMVRVGYMPKRTLGVFPCHKLCYQVINTGKQHRKTTEHINSRVKTRDTGKQGTTAKISTHLNITPDYV